MGLSFQPTQAEPITSMQAAFTLWALQSGKLVVPMPNAIQYTAVHKALLIALEMLRNEPARDVMARLALEYDMKRRNGQLFERQICRARIAVDYFLSILGVQYPGLFIDDRMSEDEQFSYYTRRDWDTKFDITQQKIGLNGSVSI